MIEVFKYNPSRSLFFTSNDQLISLSLLGKLIIYDIKKKTIINDIVVLSKKTTILNSEIDPTNSIVCLTTIDKQLILIDISKNEVDNTLPHPNTYVNQLKFINSEVLIIIDEHNKFYIINIKTRQFHGFTKDNFDKVYL